MTKRSIREPELLAAVLENAGALVVVLDRQGRIRRFNKACEQLSGYTFAEVEGKYPWDTVLPPEDADTIRRNAFDALANKPEAVGSRGRYTNYWLSKRGARHLIDWSNTLLRDADGKMEFMVCVGTDVTERQRSEDALRKSEQRLREAERLAHTGAWELDLVTNEAWWSDEQYRINGIPKSNERPSQDVFLSLVHPEDRELINKAFVDVFATGTFEGDYRIVRPDGEMRHMHGLVKACYDATGRAIRLTGSNQDITERKRSEDRLRESEAWLRHVQAIADVGSWELDLVTDALKWSVETCRIFGRDANDCVNAHAIFLGAVHPADRDAVDRAYQASVDNRTPYDITHRILRPDGAVLWVRERGETFYDKHGKALRTIGAVQDITKNIQYEIALRESESNYRTLTESANVGILVANPLRSLYANRRLLDMLGYSLDEFTRIGIKETVHPSEFEKVSQRFQARLAGQPAPVAYDTVFVTRDGRSVPVEITPTVTSWQGESAGLLFVQDITERKRLERAKRETEHWFQGVYNSIEEAILVVSPDRTIATINPAAVKMFGYTSDEVKNQSTEIFHVGHERYLEFGERIRAAFANNETATFEYLAKRKNGDIFPTEHAVSLLKNDAGEALGIVSVVRDITARKENENALRASNQIIAAVLDTTPVLIAYLDTDMNFVRVNRAYAATDHREPEYFVGKNHFALYPNAENEVIFRRVAATGAAHVAKAKPFEYAHGPERGVTHWDWTLTPIKNNTGTVTGLVLSLLNVTDRIEALEAAKSGEQELKALAETLEARVQERTAEVRQQNHRNEMILNTTLDGFFAADVMGRIRVANPAFCTMLGYTEAELLRMNVPDIEANESPQDVAAHIANVTACGYDRFDTRHRRKDGSLVDVEISVNVVDIGGEKMIYAFARDITARIESEAALIRARDEAEHANRAKSEFLSRMSHELRTPMNAILGFAQILEMVNLNPEQIEFVQEIHRAGDHLLELINELLDLARIEAGKLVVVVQPLNLGAIVGDAIQITHPLVTEKRVTLHNKCDPRAAVLADPTRLKQILVNLLSNAAKYNRDEGNIVVDCRAQNEERLRITVTDTGPGIYPEKLALLFKPFERLGAEENAIEGTGIGLAISKQLAERMGGALGVESTPGQGSTFWIELPLARAEPAPTQTAVRPPIQRGGRHTVLYVEDNAANLRVVEAIFRRYPNINLLSATNGEHGLELARRYKPNAILLDIHLPGMDGYAVFEELRTDPATRGIPVLALSADAMPFEIEQGLRAGFTQYLTKPIKVNDLMAALDRVLPVVAGH